jgi:hypothetical protein
MSSTRACVALLSCALAACVRNLPGEDPPADAFYYPNGIVASVDGAHAYVVSSNFDQRFNAGWVGVIDVAEAENGRKDAIVQQLKVPSLGGDIALSPDGRLAVVAHRGQQMLTVIDVSADGSRLTCGKKSDDAGLDTSEERTDCDRDHLVFIDPDDERWNGTVDPREVKDAYAVALFRQFASDREWPTPVCAPLDGDAAGCGATEGCMVEGATCVRNLLVLAVGFISSGRMLLYEVRADASEILVPLRSIALGTSGSGSITSYRTSPETGPTPSFVSADHLAVTSREFGVNSRLSTVYGVDVRRCLEERKNVVTTISLSGRAGGRELIDLVFSPDSSRAYASDNLPDSLVIFDTTLGGFQEANEDTGYVAIERPRYATLDAVPIEGQPAGLGYLRRASGDLLLSLSFTGDTLYLSHVVGDQLWPAFRVDDIGEGPYQAAVIANPAGDEHRVLVTTFFDHSVAVLEVPEVLELTDVVAYLRDRSLGDAGDER